MCNKPLLLILSHVFPLPGKSGQQQRVLHTLKAVRELFHVTFVGSMEAGYVQQASDKLSVLCDDTIMLPSAYANSRVGRAWHKAAGAIYTFHTGLKFTNYVIGRLEFAAARLAPILESAEFDCALFEYWHAARSVSAFHKRDIPCVLDMHGILWQSYAKQLDAIPGLPAWWRRWALDKYKAHEERAWNEFDGIIAINAAEYEYVRSKVASSVQVFYAPMGIDLNVWSYSWKPMRPPRIAYYGGMSSPHSQRAALACHESVMPEIWREFPKAEFWLVGSNPSDSLRALSDERVRVTGYIEHVRQLLKTMSVVVCPWSGTYGFRSRLVEVMALGVPVVASPQAVYGMGMDVGRGLFLEEKPRQMAETCLNLIRNSELASRQSRLARQQIEEKFSFQTTYERLALELLEFTIRKRKKHVCRRRAD